MKETRTYKFDTNEKKQKIIEIYNTKYNKIITAIFDDDNEKNKMKEVLNQLSKYYINDMLNWKAKLKNVLNTKFSHFLFLWKY